jgi:pimeloyl-ACP methyl ester carboxylesterase
MHTNIHRLLTATYQDFERKEVVVRDGSSLVTYEFGPEDGRTVVIVNPVGVPVVIASRLARRLGERYRVICWEQRGYGMARNDFLARPHDYAAYVADLLDVAAASTGVPAAVVGICSGAALAITAVARNMIRPLSLVLVCPAVRFSAGYVPSIFDSAFVPYMRMISAGNQPFARELLDMRAAYAKEPRAGTPGIDEQIIETADTLSLQSLDSLLVYARTLQVFKDETLDGDIRRVRQKTVVFATADDKTVSVQSIRQLCKLLPNAELREYERGGHLAVFTREDVRQGIVDTIDASLTSRLPKASGTSHGAG